MSHLPHSCPVCGSGTTTSGPCENCIGREPFPYFPVDEAAPVPLEAWEKLGPKPVPDNFSDLLEGSFDIEQDCKECGTRLTSKNRVDIKEFEELCYTCYKKKPKHVCVDLDGVLAQYDGWKGPHYIGPPRDGAREFLKALVKAGYQVIIHTTRKSLVVSEWLRQYDMKHLVVLVTSEKRPALAYIDDRAIPFEGDFGDCLEAVKEFVPYWRRVKV